MGRMIFIFVGLFQFLLTAMGPERIHNEIDCWCVDMLCVHVHIRC